MSPVDWRWISLSGNEKSTLELTRSSNDLSMKYAIINICAAYVFLAKFDKIEFHILLSLQFPKKYLVEQRRTSIIQIARTTACVYVFGNASRATLHVISFIFFEVLFFLLYLISSSCITNSLLNINIGLSIAVLYYSIVSLLVHFCPCWTWSNYWSSRGRHTL